MRCLVFVWIEWYRENRKHDFSLLFHRPDQNMINLHTTITVLYVRIGARSSNSRLTTVGSGPQSQDQRNVKNRTLYPLLSVASRVYINHHFHLCEALSLLDFFCRLLQLSALRQHTHCVRSENVKKTEERIAHYLNAEPTTTKRPLAVECSLQRTNRKRRFRPTLSVRAAIG